jgi:hypothetical protein
MVKGKEEEFMDGYSEGHSGVEFQEQSDLKNLRLNFDFLKLSDSQSKLCVNV